MAVADIYDALVTDRPYHRGMTRKGALATIEREAGIGLIDANVVFHLAALMREEGDGVG